MILDNVLYPKNVEIVAAAEAGLANPPGISPTVRGRINPVGQFDSAAASVEYFYGLGIANPAESYDVSLMEAVGNLVFVELGLVVRVNNASEASRIPIGGYFSFGPDGLVCGYELTVHRLGLIVAIPPEMEMTSIQQACGGIQQICTGPNQQYDSVEACIGFMASIPFGTYDRPDQNNVVCRQYHLALASINPTSHCPHSGPTGGGKCVDKTPDDYPSGSFVCN